MPLPVLGPVIFEPDPLPAGELHLERCAMKLGVLGEPRQGGPDVDQ